MKTIGRYQIKTELGRGGMATVYRAFDPGVSRDVAIKILPPEFLHDPTFRTRFEREARIIAGLEHTAIVPVYDFGEEAGQPYLVMRYMAGGSLADRLRRGPISPVEAEHIVAQIAPALDAAHRKGVVHRDLKPGNILFDEYGSPHIADFGVAKLMEAGASFTNSVILGTPAYMSPEQVEGDVPVDGRSDIYSLGVILYEMFSGKHPYDADTPLSQALMHVRRPAPRLRDVVPDAPAGVDQVIFTAMAKSRETRYATATEMATDLSRAIASVDPSSDRTVLLPGRARPMTQVTQPMPTHRRSPWLVSALGIALLVIIVLVFLVSRMSDSRRVESPTQEQAVAIARTDPTSTPNSVAALPTEGNPTVRPPSAPVATVDERPPTSIPTMEFTPPPTASPSPTPTPVLTPTVRSSGVVNVRTGPDTAYPTLGQLTPDIVVDVLGQNLAKTWLQVCCVDGQSGWVLAELFPLTGPLTVPVIDNVPPPPVAGQIVFGSDRNGFSNIFVIPGRGGAPRAVTAGQEYYWNPISSQGGSLLAYVSKVAGNTEVFVSGRNGENARTVSNHPAVDDHPAWFPGSQELMFASDRSGTWQLYRMNADGQNQRQVTFSGSDNRFPAVSPDGARIAYVAAGGAYPVLELIVMNSDGSNPRSILSFSSRKQRDDIGRYVFRPDWSPDGTLLVFGADHNDDGVINVLKVDAASGEVQELVENANCPAWSPEGQRIVYMQGGEDQILHVANATGGYLYQLTDSSYNAWSPGWTQ